MVTVAPSTDSSADAPYTYGTAAPIYREAGWPGVLPLPPRSKRLGLTGFTGRGGVDPTDAQHEAWAASPKHRGGNLALRVPLGVVVIDVDAYDGKRGGHMLAALEAECGPLPDTFISTSRLHDEVSGKRWYRVPEDSVGWHDPGEGVEILHHGHRYDAAWPSIHPDTGQRNRWLDPDGHLMDEGQVPYVEDLAELPATWVTRLQQRVDPERIYNYSAPVIETSETSGYGLAILERVMVDAEGLASRPGDRHKRRHRGAPDGFYDLCRTVWQFAFGGEIAHDDAEATLRRAAEMSDHDHDGCATTDIASARQWAAHRPRSAPQRPASSSTTIDPPTTRHDELAAIAGEINLTRATISRVIGHADAITLVLDTVAGERTVRIAASQMTRGREVCTRIGVAALDPDVSAPDGYGGWQPTVRRIIAAAEPERISEEESDGGGIRLALGEYLIHRVAVDAADKSLHGASPDVVTDEGRTLIALDPFRRWLQAHRGERLTNSDLARILRGLGSQVVEIDRRRVGGVRGRYWPLPDGLQ